MTRYERGGSSTPHDRPLDTNGTMRLRLGRGGQFELTLVAPERGFYGMVRSAGARRQAITTVSGASWNHVEIERAAASGGAGSFDVEAPLAGTVITEPDGQLAIKVDRTDYVAGRPRVRTITRVLGGDEVRWRSFGTTGAIRGEGRLTGGSGLGIDSGGRPVTITTKGNQQTKVRTLDDGSVRTDVTVTSPQGTVRTFEVIDVAGQTKAWGREDRDPASDGWSRTSVQGDGAGGKIVINETGTGSDVETHDATHTDAAGNLVKTERSAEGHDDQGNSSKTTSEVDYQTGQVTITTKTNDGKAISEHVTVVDANGQVIVDSTSEQPAPGSGGGDPGGGAPGGGDPGGGDPGGGDPGGGDPGGGDPGGGDPGGGDPGGGDPGGGDPGGGDPGGGDPGGGDPGGGDPGGGDPGGGDPGEGGGGGGGGGSDDAPDDDGEGGRPGHRFGGKHGLGPSFPGGVVGVILGALERGPRGGGGEGNEGEGLVGIVGERIRRVIASASSISDGGDSPDGSGADEIGAVVVDVRLPAAPGAVDDWGDRPNPRAFVGLIALLGGIEVALGGVAGRLNEIAGGGAAR